MLVVTQPSRLPATILSRCQRIRIRAPARQEAVAWLEASRGPGGLECGAGYVGRGPNAGCRGRPQGRGEVGQEVRRTLEEAATGGGDPVATAERWTRAELPLRLRCIENWLTERIRAHSGGDGFFTKVGAAPYLPRHDAVLNMGHLFELVDGVRELKSALDTPINRGLALEAILRRFAPGSEDKNVRAGGNKPGLLTLTIKDKSALYLAYMPFVKNGGLFIPTNSNYRLGDEVFMLLNLMGEDEKLPVAGRVIWVTPKGAQGKRTAGIGVQFSEQDRGQTQKKIETYLAGALSGDKATHTM